MGKYDFGEKARRTIKDRDGGCIFCRAYGNSGFPATQIAHYIPRSHGGLGVPENGAYVCAPHHQNLDNSPLRQKYMAFFKRYLQGHYKIWNENDLIYDKWRWSR